MKKTLLMVFGIVAAFILGTQKSEACSRVVYTGDTTETTTEGETETPVQPLRIVGRTLDWTSPIPTNIFVYPRGMKKKSNDKGEIIEWTSKYGAVYAAGYNAGITEGMNEKGLCINGLFCKGTIYNTPEVEQSNMPQMSLAVIVAWMLDNCATTQEVVDMVKGQGFVVVGATFDGGTVSTLHWGVTDAEGNTAVLEFHDGKLDIYQGDYPVLTNDPVFPSMLAINNYWESVGGQNFLPGTGKSPDRFRRGFYYDNHVERTNDLSTGLAIIRAIMNNCAAVYKYQLDDKFQMQTQWRSFSNLRDKTYYFANSQDLGLYYVDLMECNLNEGASVLYFDTQNATTAVGNITGQMVPSEPFTPMY